MSQNDSKNQNRKELSAEICYNLQLLAHSQCINALAEVESEPKTLEQKERPMQLPSST